jgi:uncharacterized protein (TIRG00374 family)
MRKNAVRFAVIFALTIVFLFFFFRSVDWREVYRYLVNVNVWLFIAVIFISSLHLITRGYRWQFLLHQEKKNVSFYNMFAGNAVGFTINFIFPGRLGEFIKPLYLAQKEGIRKGFAIGTVVVERIFDMFTMCALLGIFMIARPLFATIFQVNAEAYRNLNFWGLVGLAFASGLLLFSLGLYFFREKTLALVTFILRPFPQKFTGRVLKLSEEFIAGLKFFHSLKSLLLYAFFSFVVWIGIIFYYWVFFAAFRIRLPFFVLFPYVFLTMVGASIPTPGMVGGFHYFSKLAMTQLYGTNPNQAVGVTIVVHALQIVVTCLIGYAILWKEGLSLFQLKKLGEDAQT